MMELSHSESSRSCSPVPPLRSQGEGGISGVTDRRLLPLAHPDRHRVPLARPARLRSRLGAQSSRQRIGVKWQRLLPLRVVALPWLRGSLPPGLCADRL